MVSTRQKPRYTYAQYVAIENESTIKHEFLDGVIYAMAGATEDHAALSAKIIAALDASIGERKFRVFTSDLRVYVESAGLATFPDVSVVCGDMQQHEPSPKSTALNPMILVEVTSDSSEEYDMVTKLEIYRSIPSLREYIIVSHRERRVTVHQRDQGGAWTTRVAIASGRVRIDSLDAELVVDAIYRGTQL